MNCRHPFDALRWTPGRNGNPYPSRPHSWCVACALELFDPMSAKDFLEMRAQAFEQETNGKDPTVHRDMFYNQLEVGASVVCPISYSSSVQMSEAKIMNIDHGIPSYGKEDEIKAQLRHGEPWKMKLMPTGRTSRYNSYWSGRNGGKQHAVTLSATAGSVVALP